MGICFLCRSKRFDYLYINQQFHPTVIRGNNLFVVGCEIYAVNWIFTRGFRLIISDNKSKTNKDTGAEMPTVHSFVNGRGEAARGYYSMGLNPISNFTYLRRQANTCSPCLQGLIK